MILLPLGLIFVFFYINVGIGSHTVDMLPDALGYVLIALGAQRLGPRSEGFAALRMLSIALAVYSVAVRLLVPTGLTGLLLSLVELLLQLWLLRRIVQGIEELELRVGAHLNAALLDRWRLALTGVWAASFVGALLDTLLGGIGLIGSLIAAVWIVLCVLFLIVLFRTSRRYRLLTHKE